MNKDGLYSVWFSDALYKVTYKSLVVSFLRYDESSPLYKCWYRSTKFGEYR